MEIVLLEPFMVGSHAAWAEEYATHSRHNVRILSLPGRHWKWRMHGGAVSLARQFLAGGHRPDLLLATDMLDLTTFLALTRDLTAGIPVALFMHENQLSYPWSPEDADPGLQRDAHYSFINYASALAADAVLFNSAYHRNDFLAELPGFLQSFPDCNETDSSAQIAEKSQTLHLGLDLRKFDHCELEAGPSGRPPLILWNHRWEYDKNPQDFFSALFDLNERGIDFELAVLGESYRKQPAIFSEARKTLADKIIHWGYVESFTAYAQWLWRADILPVTSVHDFFGASVVQAIYCNCRPLLPKRLAYPEHLSRELHGEFFYQDHDDLVNRLASFCRDRRRVDLSAQVARYDWGQIGTVYDRLFEDLVAGERVFGG